VSRQVSYHEAASTPRTEAVPLAHLSIELGHLYSEELAAGAEVIRQHFQRVAPWAAAAREALAAALPGRAPRVSTCLLVDDYLAQAGSPAVVVPHLLAGAQQCGLQIDYLARESGCVEADGIPVAELVEDRIVADPPPGTNGARPPATETGWLCNGARTPGAAAVEAMAPSVGWRPPSENATARHSVFVDVELWDTGPGGRTWSCAFVSAVWQLLRLGLLRSRGAPVAVPRPWDGDLPDRWPELPAVAQVNPHAAPFSAYRSLSILAARHLANEHAVGTILSQVAIDAAVAGQVLDRGRAEGFRLPEMHVDRLDYVFVGDPT
jgi:hypothetical protein